MGAESEYLIKQAHEIALYFDRAQRFVSKRSYEKYFSDIAEKWDICIFGGGALGNQIVRWLLQINVKPAFFCDNNEKMRGTLLNEKIPYISFTELERRKNTVYVIVAIGNRDINEKINIQLSSFPYVLHNPLGITVYWAQQFNIEKMEFSQIAAHICMKNYYEEEYSVQLFQKLLGLRLQHEVIDYDINIISADYSETQYVVKDLIDYSLIHTYVDCGAFTGDTLDTFVALKTQADYYLFEMDEFLCGQLKDHVKKLNSDLQGRIHIYPYGVGKSNEKVHYVSDLTGGSKVTDVLENEAETVRLDDIKFDKKIDFIKMDIEGMEEEALLGAKRLILDDHPVLAISVYHNLAQFVRIPMLIRKMFPCYRLYLRHHKYTIDDTVCYAIYGKE